MTASDKTVTPQGAAGPPSEATVSDGVGERRALLRARRRDARDRLRDLEALVGRIVESATDSNADDEHDPEGATIAWDRAQAAALADQARAHLADLDAALARLDAGRDDACTACGEPIPAERLRVRPEATRCVRCAGGRPRG